MLPASVAIQSPGVRMEGIKKPRVSAGFFMLSVQIHHPQLLPQEPQDEPPLSGTLEEMAKPERGPASTKSTLMLPQLFNKLASTRNFKSPWSKTLSDFFGSSRAKPRDGPAQPPCISAIRMAESILFCSRYALRFFNARSVTFNIVGTSSLKNLKNMGKWKMSI